MSWDDWCKRAITSSVDGSTIGTKCGIFDIKEGGKWGSVPADFTMTPAILKTIVGGINGANRDAIHIDGHKYQYLRQMDIEGNKYALYKWEQTGFTCAVTNLAVIVGFYESGLQAGVHANAIYSLMCMLKELNQ